MDKINENLSCFALHVATSSSLKDSYVHSSMPLFWLVSVGLNETFHIRYPVSSKTWDKSHGV